MNQNNKVFVAGFDYATTINDLGALFEGAGKVIEAIVITDKATGKSKGFGFVEFENSEQAQKAIEMFNGKDFNGRELTVNVARPKEY